MFEHQSAVTDTLATFAILAVELTVLFLGISYFVGVLQQYIPPEKIKRILSSRQGRGYVVAGFLGAITPFCSCSTIPFLKGLLRAKAGFGTMMVFLFASPLLNPVIIGLFVMLFGWQVAVLYFVVAMSVSVVAGYVLERLGFERYVRPESYLEPAPRKQGGQAGIPSGSHWRRIWDSTWADFRRLSPLLLLGVSVGALIYGFMPADYVASAAGEDNPLAIPIAAVIGIPLYIRAEAVIPLSAALAAKGMGLGAVMALIIGSAGASLTEVILLRSLFGFKMILAFLTVILSMAIGAGYLYSVIF